MKKFMDDQFLLESPTAVKLYEEYAKDMPVFDFHNHLNTQEMFEDKKFATITEAWLGFDHYKWRLMRAMGVEEYYITGEASDWEKFQKYAECMPYLIGNPVYHWTHMELQRYFGIDEPLTAETAEEIYEKCNTMLQQDDFSARNLLRRMNVVAMNTTDDPKDDLGWHKKLKEDGFDINVMPAFRPDNATAMEKPSFVPYLKDLGAVVGYEIDTYAKLEQALLERIDYFYENGARSADHGLDTMLYEESTPEEVEAIFQKALAGEKVSREELGKYKGRLLTALGEKYHELDMVMLLHIGPMRNNSTRRFKEIGPDAGFDSMNDENVAIPLSRFLDSLDYQKKMPRTVLFCLNPKDNEVMATIAADFSEGPTKGLVQFGTAWWFNDNLDGMYRQLEAVAQMGVLSNNVGMLTDSRSFLSFPRHEYYRRILCNKLGGMVDRGEYPNDIEMVGKIVQDICFNNVDAFFNKG